MSLCPHGYTANWDCPECPCPCGSGLACGECRCEPVSGGAFYCERDAPGSKRCAEQCGACASAKGRAVAEYELDPMRCWPFKEGTS